MASRRKRERNRRLAFMLEENACVCPNCGQRGRHFVAVDPIMLAVMQLPDTEPDGFWVCPKYYDPDTGRRIGH